ncbi:MAG: Hpt domain-containing protein [Treponema sp.]|jgi:HPt (histidine-containing phosphotransfer) domain-containing protein|nr:Hpt domain-containing protein [Treponema sp.]
MSNSFTGTEPEKKTDHIFSARELHENFMGNVDLIKSLLVRFIKRTEPQITRIPGLAEGGDWDTAVREAHTIKGSARNLGARDLGDMAMRWEEACKKKDAAAVKAMGPEAEGVFARFKAVAEAYLSEGESEKG